MAICLFVGRIMFEMEMWMYGLISFISGLFFSVLHDGYFKIRKNEGENFNE